MSRWGQPQVVIQGTAVLVLVSFFNSGSCSLFESNVPSLLAQPLSHFDNYLVLLLLRCLIFLVFYRWVGNLVSYVCSCVYVLMESILMGEGKNTIIPSSCFHKTVPHPFHFSRGMCTSHFPPHNNSQSLTLHLTFPFLFPLSPYIFTLSSCQLEEL